MFNLRALLPSLLFNRALLRSLLFFFVASPLYVDAWGLNTVASRRDFFSTGFAGVGAVVATSPAFAKPNDACKSGAGLNCFSGTWTPKDPKKAQADLKKVLEGYPKSGQNDVDLGGWKIVSESAAGFQVEYYSAAGKLAQTYNKGEPFTDDLSLTIASDGSSVGYKSSSRKGSRDFGVNSKRLSYIADKLSALGWST